MKIGFFTDLHLNKFKEFSGDDGRQRLVDGLRILEIVLLKFAERGCDAVVFGGDWFHNRRTIDIDVMNSTRKVLGNFPLDRFEYKFAIGGNHDWYDRGRNTSGMYFLRDYGFKVYRKFKSDVVIFDKRRYSVQFVFLPYMNHNTQTRMLEQFYPIKTKRKKIILFTHTTPVGSKVGAHTFTKGVPLLDFKDKFDFMLCGDVHQPQQIDNLYIVGAPMWHNFGDNGDRGIVIYDSVENQVERISLSRHYPKFLTVKHEQDIENNGDYYRVVKSRKQTLNKRTKIKIGMSPVKAVTEYAKKVGRGKFDIDELVKVGI